MSQLHPTFLWCENVITQTKILTLHHSASAIQNRKVVLGNTITLEILGLYTKGQRQWSEALLSSITLTYSPISFVHFPKSMYHDVILVICDYYVFSSLLFFMSCLFDLHKYEV